MNYIDCLKTVNRYLMPVLSSSEYKVLVAVIERTLRWGTDEDPKYTEAIPFRHLLDGHMTGKGELTFAGTGLSKRTAIRAFNSLQDKNILRSFFGANNVNMVTIDVNLLRKLANGVKKDVKLKISKKKKELSKGCQNGTQGVSKVANKDTDYEHPDVPNSSSLRSEEVSNSPSGDDDVRKRVEAVKQRHADQEERKLRDCFEGYPNKDKLRKAFQITTARYHGKACPMVYPSGRAWGMYKNFMRGFTAPDDFDYVKFFCFTIEHWPRLFRDGYMKYSRAPLTPDISVFCGNIKRLITRYIDNVQYRDTLISSQRKYVNVEGMRKRIEDVCKDNEQLQAELERTRADIPDYNDVLRARGAEARERELVRQNEIMNRRIKSLQLENAKLRSGEHGESTTTLPSWEENQKRKGEATR